MVGGLTFALLSVFATVSAFSLLRPASIRDSDTLHKGETLAAPAELVGAGGHVRLQIQVPAPLTLQVTVSRLEGDACTYNTCCFRAMATW